MPVKSKQHADLAELFGKPVPLERRVPLRVRLIVATQGIGAVLGFCAFALNLGSGGVLDPFDLLPLAAFAFVVQQAVKAWRGADEALKRLEWLLAAQIPWLNLPDPGIHYDFYLLFDCTFRIGNAAEPLELGIGTRFEAYASTLADPAFLGVNVAAALLFGVLRAARLAMPATTHER